MQRRTYLGQKGYTILKDSITLDEQLHIKTDLTVKPNMPGNMGKTISFPIYRESAKKLYVPRFYGEKNFGIADENKLSSGDIIDLEFVGEMRQYQVDIISKYLAHVKSGKSGIGGGLLEIGCGKGKTVMALNIISKLKVKTLIIVHKGFLLSQWVERIQQFLPSARIGKIQGPHFDIEDKDIVIGMLQSLSMKDYPQELFSSFGFVCVDECHHISAEVFVRSLFVAVTPYVLGLSATMQRKDGLSKVFKHFIGGMVHSEKNDTTTQVEVRGIEYSVNDDEFNDIRTDYRGNPLYSCMISKLCDYASRTEFILGVLKDVLRENNQQQIIMLAHNKNLLNYIYKAILDRNIAEGSIGYYIGGMKDKDLKVSETKTVIMATYSMAAEALDIKTLTTLFMLTPKTDVQQAVGRILRVKHSKPLVVDFVDAHGIFQNQWKKRKAFYKKQNYRVIYTDNRNYETDTTSPNWKVVNDPEKNTKSTGTKSTGTKSKCDDTEPLEQTCKCMVTLDMLNQ
jgi:superfamily II DNA or RNA helicase